MSGYAKDEELMTDEEHAELCRCGTMAKLALDVVELFKAKGVEEKMLFDVCDLILMKRKRMAAIAAEAEEA